MFLHNAHQFSSNPITLTVNQVSLHSPIRTQGGTLWLHRNLFDLPGTHVAYIFIEARNSHFWTTRNLTWKCYFKNFDPPRGYLCSSSKLKDRTAVPFSPQQSTTKVVLAKATKHKANRQLMRFMWRTETMVLPDPKLWQ